jgi:hypothetical protein
VRCPGLRNARPVVAYPNRRLSLDRDATRVVQDVAAI